MLFCSFFYVLAPVMTNFCEGMFLGYLVSISMNNINEDLVIMSLFSCLEEWNIKFGNDVQQ